MLTRLAALALAGVLGHGGLAYAQHYPNRPVKIVVPFPAGGGTDALTRFVARGMEQRLGQPFIIENRGGAGTTLGATAVARSEPDGYTIMVGTASTFAAAPGLYKRLAYDPAKDFSPIMLFATVPFVLVVNPSLGVSSVKELIDLARSKPGELAFASAGVGAVHHIFCELFMTMTGIKMRHVPYRGGGLAMNDVVAGHVQAVSIVVVGTLSRTIGVVGPSGPPQPRGSFVSSISGPRGPKRDIRSGATTAPMDVPLCSTPLPMARSGGSSNRWVVLIAQGQCPPSNTPSNARQPRSWP